MRVETPASSDAMVWSARSSSPAKAAQIGRDTSPPDGSVGRGGVVHPTVDAAVQAARKAQEVFQDQGLEVRREIIRAMRKAAASSGS